MVSNPKDGPSAIDRFLGTEVVRLPFGNDGRGTPIKTGPLYVLFFVLGLVAGYAL